MSRPRIQAKEAERVRRTYASYAGDWRKRRAGRADNPGNLAIRAELLQLVWRAAGGLLDGDGHILDAGCGNGFWLRSLIGRGVVPQRLHGVDILPNRLAACRAALPAPVEL